MGARTRIPPYRSLDMYRLVVVRGLKQCEVAESFGVTPQRVCQVVRRVRQWVDQSIGNWLFPRRDDLRFYVALQCEGIQPYESLDEPESIVLEGRGAKYSRQVTNVSDFQGEHWQDASATQQGANNSANNGANNGPNNGPNISATLIDEPVKSAAATDSEARETTASNQTSYASALTMELAQTIANYLMHSKNKQKH